MRTQPLFRRWENVLMTLAFLIVICLPIIRQLTTPIQQMDAAEKRKLATFPKLVWKPSKITDSLKKFPAKYEKYYNDHFGFRAELLRLGANIKTKWLGVDYSLDFIAGKNGWYFYTGDDSLNDFRGLKKLSPSELATWQHWLESRHDWLQKRGIRYLFVIAPNKQTIYPEFMPWKYSKRHGPTILDQLLQYFASHHCQVPVLDLRESLLAAKKDMQTYYQLDSHWTDPAAFVGYQKMIEKMRAWYPSLVPSDASGRFEHSEIRYKPDLLGLTGLPRSQEESGPTYALPPGETQKVTSILLPNFRQLPFNQPFRLESSAPLSPLKAVILRDSFTSALRQPLARHFARATFVWFGQSNVFEKDLAGLVKTENPDVFIEIMVERHLGSLPLKRKCFGGEPAVD